MSSGGGPAVTGGRSWAGGPARWVGLGLSLAGGGWVLFVLLRHGGRLGDALVARRVWTELGLATLGYTALSSLAAGVWWWALGLYGARPPFLSGWAIWARSQAAKYLPGNVFHYVGRQLLGRREGLGHVALGAAAAVELVTLLAAAALLAAVAALWGPGIGAGLASPVVWTAALAAVGLVALIVVDALARRVPRLAAVTSGLPPLTRRRMAAVALPALVAHAAYLAVCSLLVWRLAAAVAGGEGGGEDGAAWWTVMTAYPIAWAAGTVTPGAPGGLGVREAALALQLAAALGEPAASLVALVFRVATVVGDLLITLLGWAVRRSLAGWRRRR